MVLNKPSSPDFGSFEWAIVDVLKASDRHLSLWEIEARVYESRTGGAPIHNSIEDEVDSLIQRGSLAVDEKDNLFLTEAGRKTAELAESVLVYDKVKQYFTDHPEPLRVQPAVAAICDQYGLSRNAVMETFTRLINHGPLVSSHDLTLTWGDE